MKHSVTCNWMGNVAFESEINGHRIILDASKDSGGENRGPTPKPLMLSSLAGCTGIDVILILNKMRIEPAYFNIRVEGTLTESEPRTYSAIAIIYEFSEEDRKHDDKIRKAVNLSQEKYCGVSAMLRKASELSFEIAYIPPL